jgi:hypothetical protein
MSLTRSLLMVSLVTALPFVASRAEARGPDPRTRVTRADDAQLRELLSKLAAASGEVAPEERTEADLMYEAMLRWNGEPPGSAAIERALAQSKKDAAKEKRSTQEKVRKMFWKDPFADDPTRLIPVRQEDRELLAAYKRKTDRREIREAREVRETRAPREEILRLRAELAEARAENERLRDGSGFDSSESMSQRQGCTADASSSAETRRRRRTTSGTARRHAERTRGQIALASTFQGYQTPAPAPAAPAPPPPPPATNPNPGIVIERLPSPPPPAPIAEKPRRNGSRIR